jgi:AraC-like DNA-binding protein
MSASRNHVRVGGKNREETSCSNKEIVKCPVISPASLLPLVQERRLRIILTRLTRSSAPSVHELAQEVHLSPAYLQRLFKQETGVHISDLISEQRLRAAAELLSTTEIEIKEIAYVTGYHHHSSFVRAFQRRFRQSPKQYRNRSPL